MQVLAEISSGDVHRAAIEEVHIRSRHHHDAGTRLTIRAPSRVVAELRAALSAAS